jgi:hypothetical protein
VSLARRSALRALAAAAGAEDRADEGGDGEHVVDRGRLLVDVVRAPVGVLMPSA